MAPWCGPCREMDRTTWRDEALVKWVQEHAIAIQIDGSAERGAISWTRSPRWSRSARERSWRAFALSLGARPLDWLEFCAPARAPCIDSAARSTWRRTCAAHEARARAAHGPALETRRWSASGSGRTCCASDTAPRARAPGAARAVHGMARRGRSRPRRRCFTGAPATRAPTDAQAEDGAGRRARLDWVTLNDALGDRAADREWSRVKSDESGAALRGSVRAPPGPAAAGARWWDEILASTQPAPRVPTRARLRGQPRRRGGRRDATGRAPRSGPGDVLLPTRACLYGALVSARRTKGRRGVRTEAMAHGRQRRHADHPAARGEPRRKWS